MATWAVKLRHAKLPVIWIGGVCIILGLLEGVARLIPLKDGDSAPEDMKKEMMLTIEGVPEALDFLQFDPLLFWSMKPNISWSMKPNPHQFTADSEGLVFDVRDPFTLTTNDLGLRNKPLGPKGSKRRILAVGDSTTFGWGVNDAEAWPAQLQEILDRSSPRTWEVVNAGVAGYSSFQGLRYIEERGLKLDPDVLIVSFHLNDAAWWGGFGDMKVARQIAAADRELVLAHSRLYLHIKGLLKRFHPAAQPEGTQKAPRLTPGEFERTLTKMSAVCEHRKIALIFVMWPMRDQVAGRWRVLSDHQYAIQNVARRTGRPIVDMRDAFAAATEPVYVDGAHANALGCRIAAEVIAEKLRRLFPS